MKPALLLLAALSVSSVSLAETHHVPQETIDQSKALIAVLESHDRFEGVEQTSYPIALVDATDRESIAAFLAESQPTDRADSVEFVYMFHTCFPPIKLEKKSEPASTNFHTQTEELSQ